MKPKMPQSIQSQLRTIVITVVAFSFAVVALGAVAAYTLLGSTDEFFKANEQLGQFYQTATTMTSAAREYVMDPTAEKRETYTQLQASALVHIDTAAQYTTPQIAWRFGLLSNMVDSFDEAVLLAETTKDFSYETYRHLEYLGQLIEDTQPDFVNLLLGDMSQKNQKIRFFGDGKPLSVYS